MRIEIEEGNNKPRFLARDEVNTLARHSPVTVCIDPRQLRNTALAGTVHPHYPEPGQLLLGEDEEIAPRRHKTIYAAIPRDLKRSAAFHRDTPQIEQAVVPRRNK